MGGTEIPTQKFSWNWQTQEVCGLPKQSERNSFPLTGTQRSLLGSGGQNSCWDSRGFSLGTGRFGGGGSEQWDWTNWKWRNVYITVPESPYLTCAEYPSERGDPSLKNLHVQGKVCSLVWMYLPSKAFLILASLECVACQLAQTYSIVSSGPNTPIRILGLPVRNFARLLSCTCFRSFKSYVFFGLSSASVATWLAPTFFLWM